jgi:hypothetical protein
VMPLEIVGEVPAGRAALERAILSGLAMAAAPTLPVSEAEARLRSSTTQLPCETATCWSSIGKTVEARYLIAGKVERRANLFQVEFKLIDARPGRLLASQTNRCEADDCSVAELCRLVVRELTRQNLVQPEDRASYGAPPATAAESLPAPAPVVVVATDRPAGFWSARRKWGLAAILGGVVAAGGGVYVASLDGKCANKFTFGDSGCINYHETRVAGIAAAGAGAGLVTTGVVLLLTGRGGSEQRANAGLMLSIQPRGLAVSGRF